MILYQHGCDVPKDISCVYYATDYCIERKTPSPIRNYGYMFKIGQSSNPFNRNKSLKYTHIIYCFDVGKYGLVHEKEREFVEKFIQAKIVKYKIATSDCYGGDHFFFNDLAIHDYMLRHFDEWALEGVKAYKAL